MAEEMGLLLEYRLAGEVPVFLPQLRQAEELFRLRSRSLAEEMGLLLEYRRAGEARAALLQCRLMGQVAGLLPVLGLAGLRPAEGRDPMLGRDQRENLRRVGLRSRWANLWVRRPLAHRLEQRRDFPRMAEGQLDRSCRLLVAN
jgi:hypothetical protein